MVYFDFINYFLAFLEGLALILSPCILPILPILLSGTLASGKRGPLGIIVGFTLTFALFTLGSHFLVSQLGVNLDRLRDIAFLLIALFGIVMLSDYLTVKFSLLTQKLANFSTHFSGKTHNGFWSGLLLGSIVSLVWTPCAGPILAAALIQIAVQKTLFSSAITLLAFALGSIIPMVLIAFLGKKLLQSIKPIKRHTDVLRKIFGGIIIITALALAYISHFKPNLLASLAAPPVPSQKKSPSLVATGLEDPLAAPYQAPPLEGLDPWINSPPLTLDSLKGKVILIDFWTYSCINCLRTLPYLLAWDKAYRNQGLVIIGVHTPEFEFEKNSNNVRQAVERLGIFYPVALDNQYATWNNYKNHYWPAHYLIDKEGRIVYQHFGEGEYSATEHNIRILLGLNSTNSISNTMPKENEPDYGQTPETYLGYERSESFSNSQPQENDKTGNYIFPSQLPLNHWALNGAWMIKAEKIITSQPMAAIKIHFQARSVYVVMGTTTETPIRVKVLFNNQPLEDSQAGKDIKNSAMIITGQRLYEIAKFSHVVNGEIDLIFEKPGVELYTFTFG